MPAMWRNNSTFVSLVRVHIYVNVCRGLNAPETVGQYAVIFIYKDGKHNLASSVVSNLSLSTVLLLLFYNSVYKYS